MSGLGRLRWRGPLSPCDAWCQRWPMWGLPRFAGQATGHCGDRFHPSATAWTSVHNQPSPFAASTTALEYESAPGT